MKRLLLMLLAVLTLTSCDKKKDDDIIKGDYANLYINGKQGNKSTGQHKMTVHEVCTAYERLTLWMTNSYGTNGIEFTANPTSDGEFVIDTIADRLIMKASCVIEKGHMNYLGGSIVMARNFYITKELFPGLDDVEEESRDTLAYIPNEVMREAQITVLDLWKEGKVSEIYQRFQDMLYFVPCTGEEFENSIKEDIDWEHEYDNLLPEHAHTHEIEWNFD